MKILRSLFAIALVPALTSIADARQPKRHKQTMQPARTAAPWRPDTAPHQPARMIEVKPGYWISSYGCAQDAGYGRFTPCDLTDGNAH
jgi:hypothetical protein